VSGDDQVEFPGRIFPVPVSVLATDRFGNPTPGVEVSFAVDARGGSVEPSTVATDAEGIAAASWTAGSELAENVLVASVEAGASVVYTAAVVSPGTGKIAVSEWEGPVEGGIYLMNPDGTDLAPLPLKLAPTATRSGRRTARDWPSTRSDSAASRSPSSMPTEVDWFAPHRWRETHTPRWRAGRPTGLASSS
jgi:hypothetical protein